MKAQKFIRVNPLFSGKIRALLCKFLLTHNTRYHYFFCTGISTTIVVPALGAESITTVP